jgi:hypothetical protein
VAVLTLVVWWRQREARVAVAPRADAAQVATDEVGGSTTVRVAVPRRTFLAPASTTVTAVVAVLSILVAGAAIYDIYRIGDSGAKASWQGQFSSTPTPRGPGQ